MSEDRCISLLESLIRELSAKQQHYFILARALERKGKSAPRQDGISDGLVLALRLVREVYANFIENEPVVAKAQSEE